MPRKARAETPSAQIRPLTGALLRRFPPCKAGAAGSKDERGCVLVVGGSREVGGALLLTALAVLRAGAGKVQVATVRSAAATLTAALPEALVTGLDESPDGELTGEPSQRLAELAEHADAIVLGPGMFHEAGALRLLQQMVVANPAGVWILDACAIAILRDHVPAQLRGRAILTPHAGEMARLTGNTREYVENNAAVVAHTVSQRSGVVVALKGARTLVAAPDEPLYEQQGHAGLGTAGSGDVLAGMIAGLAARGATPLAATLWGVHVHAQAGAHLGRSIAPLGYLARELLPVIPGLLARAVSHTR